MCQVFVIILRGKTEHFRRPSKTLSQQFNNFKGKQFNLRLWPAKQLPNDVYYSKRLFKCNMQNISRIRQ